MFSYLTDALSSVFSSLSGKRFVDDAVIQEFLQGITNALLDADVPYELVQDFIKTVREDISKKPIHSKNASDQLRVLVYEKIVAFLGGAGVVSFTPKQGSAVMVLGLQGSGKTTTLAKLAHHVLGQQKKWRILVASVDYYRPAAIDQLEILTHQSGASFYRARATQPCQAAQEIYDVFTREKYDVLFLDTAGRLHIDDTMMSELRDINSIIKPQHKILVLDSMTGQESLAVGRAFEQGTGFDSAVLTKTDSDSRGGALFSFRYALKKPILFLGNGEKLADLDQYNPSRTAGKLLGMGDLEGLSNKMKAIEASEQEQIAKNFGTDAFTLADFSKQLEMMGKIGSLSSIAQYIPGMGKLKIDPEMLEKGEKELKIFKAIISSMTPRERIQTKSLNGSRKERIAKGAGVAVSEVNKLLQRFEEMQQYAKLMKRMGGFNGIFRGR